MAVVGVKYHYNLCWVCMAVVGVKYIICAGCVWLLLALNIIICAGCVWLLLALIHLSVLCVYGPGAATQEQKGMTTRVSQLSNSWNPGPSLSWPELSYHAVPDVVRTKTHRPSLPFGAAPSLSWRPVYRWMASSNPFDRRIPLVGVVFAGQNGGNRTEGSVDNEISSSTQHGERIQSLARPSHYKSIINQNGATSGFEMYFAPSTFGAGGPNRNTSRIQHKDV